MGETNRKNRCIIWLLQCYSHLSWSKCIAMASLHMKLSGEISVWSTNSRRLFCFHLSQLSCTKAITQSWKTLSDMFLAGRAIQKRNRLTQGHTPSQIYDTPGQTLVEEEWETPYYFMSSNLQVATKDVRHCLSKPIKLISLIMWVGIYLHWSSVIFAVRKITLPWRESSHKFYDTSSMGLLHSFT